MSSISNTNSGKQSRDECTSAKSIEETFDKTKPSSVLSEFAKLGNEYSKAIGSYCVWDLDVNVGPPPCFTGPPPSEDGFLQDYYNSLQYTLYETGFPETVDRTDKPRKGSSNNDVTITILSSPVECMAILLEGGEQTPGNMLLVLSLTWVSKVKVEDSVDLYSLLVHKAISFHSSGHTYVDAYDPPRRTTYLVNFFTDACTGGQRDDGPAIEADLDCFMSSSQRLVQLVDDKVWTGCVMAMVGMGYPETLALVCQSDLNYSTQRSKINIFRFTDVTELKSSVAPVVANFIQLDYMQDHEMVVVKPSGIRAHGSIGVTYVATSDVDSIVRAVIQLAEGLGPGDAVLVETYCSTFAPRQPDSSESWHATEGLGFRIRSTVCRAPGDVAICSQVSCGVSDQSKPICGDNTVPQSLTSTLLAYGLTNTEVKNIHREICVKSEAVLTMLIEQERRMGPIERGERGAFTDLIGIDLVLTIKDGSISPVGIEVNSHDCSINCQLYEFMNPELQGQAVRPLVSSMVTKSHRYILSKKKILVIGDGREPWKEILKDLSGFNVQIVLVAKENNLITENADIHFLKYDITDHTKDDIQAVLDLLETDGISVDGCLTFQDEYKSLTAAISEKLELNGAGLRGTNISASLSSTHAVLREKTGDIPHWPRTYLYTVHSHTITDVSDLEHVPTSFVFPAALLPDRHYQSMEPMVVYSVEEAISKFTQFSHTLKEDSNNGIIDDKMLLVEQAKGTDHYIDVVLHRRKKVAIFISDSDWNMKSKDKRLDINVANRRGLPSVLPSDKLAQLTCAAYQCCTEIGLITGIFCVRMKMTPIGPRLVHLHTGPSSPERRKWIREWYGEDMVLWTLLLACDIRPNRQNCLPNSDIAKVLRSLEKNVDESILALRIRQHIDEDVIVTPVKKGDRTSQVERWTFSS